MKWFQVETFNQEMMLSSDLNNFGPLITLNSRIGPPDLYEARPGIEKWLKNEKIEN